MAILHLLLAQTEEEVRRQDIGRTVCCNVFTVSTPLRKPSTHSILSSLIYTVIPSLHLTSAEHSTHMSATALVICEQKCSGSLSDTSVPRKRGCSSSTLWSCCDIGAVGFSSKNTISDIFQHIGFTRLLALSMPPQMLQE